MSRPMRLAALAAFLIGTCVAGFDPANLTGQSAASFESSSTGTVLVAVLPQTARVGWWVLPAEPSWFASGYSGNLLVIEQQWSIARGTSINADCTVSPPLGEVAELMPLEQFDGETVPRGYLDAAGTRTVPLAVSLSPNGKPLVNLRTLVVAHSEALREPILVDIRLVAF